MIRSPQEVFSAHIAAVTDRDVTAILQDYREDAVLLTPQGAMEGRSGVETFYTQALAALPQLEMTVTPPFLQVTRFWSSEPHPRRQAAYLMASTHSHSLTVRSNFRHQPSRSSR